MAQAVKNRIFPYIISVIHYKVYFPSMGMVRRKKRKEEEKNSSTNKTDQRKDLKFPKKKKEKNEIEMENRPQSGTNILQICISRVDSSSTF